MTWPGLKTLVPTPLDTPCLTERPGGAERRLGYANVWVGDGSIPGTTRRRYPLHRLVWEEAYGPLEADQFVMHLCDNPPCWRLSHLRVGTPEDNMKDMLAKGRARRSVPPAPERKGAPAWQRKLSAETIALMRELHGGGVSYSEIGRRFGVSRTTATDAITGRFYRDLDLPPATGEGA